MQEMVDAIQRIARASAAQQWAPALAVVTSVHTGNGTTELTATVALRETGIVLPHVPIPVGVLGFAAPPAEGDLVAVGFAAGDLHAPFVIGRLYDDEVAPPASQPGQVVAWLPRAAPDENKRLELTVSTPDDGTRTLHVRLAGDAAVDVTITDGKVTLAAGVATVTLSQSSSSDAKAEVVVGDAKLTLEQAGDVAVEAKGKLTLKANTVEISGQSEVKIAGQTIKLN